MTALLETRSLVKNFGALRATRDVTFALEEGARHALIGPNGAGKTTFINLLTGVLMPSTGQVLFKGQDITIYGDGEQTRDFTYVENAVQANLLACEAPGASGGVFNIGTGERVSLNQTLTLLRQLSGKYLEAKYEPAREGDIRDSQADISNARQSLGYEPAVRFGEGLERTFSWYQANQAKEEAK